MTSGRLHVERRQGRGSTPLLQSVIRGLRVLSLVERAPAGRSITELGAVLGLNKTTVFRLVRTLCEEGLVAKQSETGRYVQAPHYWLKTALYLPPGLSLIAEIQQILSGLAEETGLSVLVNTPNELGREIVVRMFAVPRVAFYLDPAYRSRTREPPLHATAAGKCCLAFAPREEISQYIFGGLEKIARRTITSPARLKRELAQVRRQGYAVNVNEALPGAPGLAVPVRDGFGKVIGGLALAFSAESLEPRQVSAHLGALNRSSTAISELLEPDSWLTRVRQTLGETAAPPIRLVRPDAERGSGSTPTVRSLARAVRIMTLLLGSPRGLPFAEIARRRRLNTATTRRLLRTLEAEMLVMHDRAAHRYHVSPTLYLLKALALQAGGSLTSVLRQLLADVARVAGATVGLVSPDGEQRAAVLRLHALPDRAVCHRPLLGEVHPLHSTAGGKCWLAHQDEEIAARYLDAGLVAKTKHTITSPEQLQDELVGVRRRGYAISREESTVGGCGLAVPVLNEDGTAMACINLAAPIGELTPANTEKWLSLLRGVGDTMGRILSADWRSQVSGSGASSDGG